MHDIMHNLQDMHLLAERHILTGLKAGGWLKGEVEEMLEQRVAALFMPHGTPCITNNHAGIATAVALVVQAMMIVQFLDMLSVRTRMGLLCRLCVAELQHRRKQHETAHQVSLARGCVAALGCDTSTALLAQSTRVSCC